MEAHGANDTMLLLRQFPPLLLQETGKWAVHTAQGEQTAFIRAKITPADRGGLLLTSLPNKVDKHGNRGTAASIKKREGKEEGKKGRKRNLRICRHIGAVYHLLWSCLIRPVTHTCKEQCHCMWFLYSNQKVWQLFFCFYEYWCICVSQRIKLKS